VYLDSAAWIYPFFFFIGAAGLMLLCGPLLIKKLRSKQWRKGAPSWTVREDTPDTHIAKQGTPSMGGLGIAASALFAYVFYTVVIRYFIFAADDFYSLLPVNFHAEDFYLLPGITVMFALLGFSDDWSKATGRGGLRAKTKLIAQIALSLIWVVLLTSYVIQHYSGNYDFPEDNLGLVIVMGLVCCLVIIAMSNAVNLTDGIDGLAAGLAVQSGIFLYLAFPARAVTYGIDLTSLFVIALAGACLGFLYFNKHKARVFMGDTGSLAIGAALGAGAILQHAVFLLPFIGFIYFVEAASVTLQVLWFKYTRRTTGEGKRLFRRAPLHHHFELGGWSEWRVVLTFWAVNLFTSVIGLWLWHAGVLPRWP
jgi:phospho-N-acetylmuramoyl-pentapeptide-transferase